MRVKTQFKENPKTSKTTKEATTENKHGEADGHENEAQRPLKKLRGVANFQSSLKIENDIRK